MSIADMSDVLVVGGIDRKASADEVRRVTRRVFEEAAAGFRWLRPGDRVLLKVALNSPDPYPATTSPLAVRAVVEALRDRGARVVVGDMPGVEYVLLGPKGSMKRSSRECFERSGMGEGSDVTFIGFEERGWQEGFSHYRRDAGISADLPNHRRFFEKITEINLAVADRQRLTLCLATEGQVTFGPDRRVPI